MQRWTWSTKGKAPVEMSGAAVVDANVACFMDNNYNNIIATIRLARIGANFRNDPISIVL